ncbi:MAG: AAA family ATPase [Oceanospirillaceae bacterium]|nr:AAA family ATPase [Oceanospirillaceae bacterium]
MGKHQRTLLVSWIGAHDLKGLQGDSSGPVIDTLDQVKPDRTVLLYNYPEEAVQPYLERVKVRYPDLVLQAFPVSLSSPVHYGDIYRAAEYHLQQVLQPDENLALLLSPGTPAMQAVWVLLGKTRFPALFYQASREQGVQQIDVPFDIAAEYIPAADKLSSRQLNQLALADAPENAALADIITRNPQMLMLKQQAQILAERDVPVLIYGETGTGKELFARAIHNASDRRDRPFVAVNCGAFPAELIDSILFGHKKGAFTGATSDKPGVFAQANGGTLFLDEFGELEPAVQVRLLRVLQDQRFTPLGAVKEEQTDLRLITATNRNLMQEVAEGRFREDLFYRIAVGVLHLPPLRSRQGDLMLLADTLLMSMAQQDHYLHNKKLSAEANNIILSHSWPGNIRELRSTLMRAALWSQQDLISADDMKQALFKRPAEEHSILNRDVSQGIDIKEVVAGVERHYILKALEHTRYNKTDAARLLGMNHYQTLSNRMDKYGIELPQSAEH